MDTRIARLARTALASFGVTALLGLAALAAPAPAGAAPDDLIVPIGDLVVPYDDNGLLDAPPEGYYDSDGDGLWDRDETGFYGTDPYAYDTDGDGMGDGAEVDAGTDPRTAAVAVPVGPSPRQLVDSDGDDLWDRDETGFYGTDPYDSDTDGDDLWDGGEVNQYGTNPLVYDTDGDGNRDGCDSDPLVPSEPYGCLKQY